MASNKLKSLQSFITQAAKSNKTITMMAFAIMMALNTQKANAQVGGVGINEANPQAGLHITSNANKG